MSDVTKDDLHDFREWMDKRLDRDFGAVNDRLDALNGRTRVNETAIAVLQDRTSEARTAGRNYGAGAGAAVGGLITVLYQAWQALSGK